ncbi:MAG TPA: hypothetical protein VNS32_19170, partial [Flavisolibacter sp.]|nr:hypothetical protein [Flavisolibacter sp.]
FTGSGVFHMSYNSTSNYAGDLVIKDASNATVKDYQVLPGTSYQEDLTINTPGTYTITLSLPSQFNPTGGATASLTQQQTQTTFGSVPVGGLRIKTMTHKDGLTSNDMVTNYSYDDNGQSYCVLYSKPVYVGVVRNDMVKNVGYWTTSGFTPSLIPNGCTTGPDATYFKSPSSIRPMATTQGYAFGYSQVKVSQPGNGYSIYQYYGDDVRGLDRNDVVVRTVNISGCDGNAANYPSAPLPFEFKRGELKYEAHYNESGTLLKDVSYTPEFTNDTFSTPGFIVAYKGQQMLATPYTLVSGRKTKMTTVTTEYPSSGTPLSTTVIENYQSKYHNQLTNKTSYGSDGDTLETRIKYAADFRVSTCDAIADGWQTYTNDCNSCLSTYNTKRIGCGDTSSCLTTAYLNYMQCQTTARINYVNYRKTNFTNATNTFQTNHNTAKAGADVLLKPILDLQDSSRNPAIEVNDWRNNKLMKSVLSVFDYVTNPVAEPYITKLQEIDLSGLSATFTVAATNNGNTSIVKDSRYKDEGYLKYNAGNLVEVTKKDGIVTSYLWGYSNSYPIATVVGTPFASVNAVVTNSILQSPASDAALRTELDKIRQQFPKSLTSSYTYTPLIGITSETSPTRKLTFYNYDALGRLTVIKDANNYVLKKIYYSYSGQQGTGPGQ